MTSPVDPVQNDRTARHQRSVSAANLSSPEVGADLRLKQQVKDALATTRGGKQLDEIFGISSGVPKQSPSEGDQSDALIRKLQAASAREGGDLRGLLGDISKHTAGSQADAEALRALMRPPRQR